MEQEVLPRINEGLFTRYTEEPERLICGSGGEGLTEQEVPGRKNKNFRRFLNKTEASIQPLQTFTAQT